MPFLNAYASDSPDQLRQLASWYRAFAERAGSSVIWEGRLHTADDLDEEADRVERLRNTSREATVLRSDLR